MAANDLIGPQAVPLKSREVTIPEQSPQLAQAKEATGQLEESIGHLLRSTASQEAYNQDADAFINAKTQINELNRNLVSIRDFDQRVKALQTGIQAIKDNVKNEPGIKPTTVKNIISAIDNDYTELYKGAVADRRINGEKDYRTVLKGLKELASKSTSDVDRNNIDIKAHTLVNSALANGYISKADADYEKWKFHYDVNLDHWKQYFGENPEDFPRIPFKSMHINWDDWLKLERSSYNQVQAKLNTFELQRKKDVYDAEQFASTHTATELDARPDIKARLSKSFLDDHFPPISEPEVDDIVRRIRTGKWDTITDLDHFWQDDAGKKKMFPEDYKRAHEVYATTRQLMGSDFGKYVRNLQHLLRLDIESRHKPNTMTGFTDPDLQIIHQLGTAISNISNTAKDTKEADKEFEDIDKKIKAKWPLPSDKAESKPEPSPTATATPALTSRAEVPSDGHDDGGSLPWSANSVYDRLSQAESGTWGKPLSGRNIIESWITDPTTPEEDRSQGYFGIKSATGREFSSSAGLPDFTRAMKLSAAEQEDLVSFMPFRDFGPRTQKLMESVYGPIDPNTTIGEMAEKYG